MDEAQAVYDKYYAVPEGDARVKWREQNPQLDAVLWMMGKVDSVRTKKAAEIADKLVDGRPIKIVSK